MTVPRSVAEVLTDHVTLERAAPEASSARGRDHSLEWGLQIVSSKLA